MPVGYRNSSASGPSDTFGTSCVIPVPSGAAANDIALVAIEQWEVANPVVTPAAGFVQLVQVVSGSQKLKVFWKRLSGGDTGNWTFTWTGSQWNMGHGLLITGGATSGDPIGTNFNTNTGTATTIPSTSVTTTTEPFLAHFVANENAATKTAPTNFTEVQDGDYLATNYRIPATTGTHSVSTGAASASTLMCVALVAVDPAAGASPVSVAVLRRQPYGALYQL